MGIYSAVVTCAEEHDTAQEGYDVDGGPTASVTLRCAWADRWDLVADIVGGSLPWPHFTGTYPPLARSAGVKPVPTHYTAVDQSIVYPEALVTVNYSTKNVDLVSESLDPTVEFLTLDFKRFRWASASGDPLIEAEAPGRLMRGLTLTRKYSRIAGPLPATILTECGKVNTAAYASSLLGLTFAAETLLYTPPHLDRTIKSDGDEGWNITFKFMYLPQTWNKFWRAKTQAYESIYIAGGALYRNYPLGDFSAFVA